MVLCKWPDSYILVDSMSLDHKGSHFDFGVVAIKTIVQNFLRLRRTYMYDCAVHMRTLFDQGCLVPCLSVLTNKYIVCHLKLLFL